jgi:transcriptional regulator with XRE-family HTH domain
MENTDSTSTAVQLFLDTVGKRIEKVRELRGLTREEVANKTGLTYAGIYAAETKGHGTQIDTLFKIASALEVKPGFLLDGGTLTITRPTDVSV